MAILLTWFFPRFTLLTCSDLRLWLVNSLRSARSLASLLIQQMKKTPKYNDFITCNSLPIDPVPSIIAVTVAMAFVFPWRHGCVPCRYNTTGLEIATHWSPMRPKMRCWRQHIKNWSPVGDSPYLQSNCSPIRNRYNAPNPQFFDRRLDRHVWFISFSLLRYTTVVTILSDRKTLKYCSYPCSKLPFYALQTLEYWVPHVCLRIASLLSGD